MRRIIVEETGWSRVVAHGRREDEVSFIEVCPDTSVELDVYGLIPRWYVGADGRGDGNDPRRTDVQGERGNKSVDSTLSWLE